MKLWRRCWMWKLLLGMVILSLRLDDGLCRKRGKSKPTIPRAFNETSFTKSSSGGKNDVQQLFAMQQPREEPRILNLGCHGIKIRRYVSNGFCTSRKAIRDTICEGRCVPMEELPFFPKFSKILSKKKKEWRCVPDYVKRRKVTVFCNDGTKRRYRIPVVRTCKCKRYTRKQNMTNPPGQLKKGSKSR
ncbi:sclerostin domain-containing protein 1 [Exaiptasia diaphana]|uniref:CTCK domain-containing protein n=1 Tax=Exaiptasia diaphana TaxID=2652724 RepID=A0A913Y9H5_EXADI|nr:sclerostin domain-containing protein 1 [Exaiptasia diaphana]KXJ28344.1 Sclerostin domain-containing protein 1 [Exaiptasia diaphana]